MDGHTYLIVRMVDIAYILLGKLELNTLLFQLPLRLFYKSFPEPPLICCQDSISSMSKRSLLKFVMLGPYGV
jgi:hypothetical protein